MGPWSLCLLALGAHPAFASLPPQPRLSPAIPGKGEFDLKSLVLDFPTGLRFIIQEDHSHPVASVYTYVGHGFYDDPVGKEETAHFVEHLWFRSVHGELPPIMFVIQDLGTLFNATTADDRTDYRTSAGIEYLPILLKLESLRLTHFYDGVTEAQVDVEREVIRNEWRGRNEQAEALLFDYINEAVYPADHPYSRYSTHETMDAIDLATLQQYVDTYYKPDQTTITIVGDFDKNDVVSKIFETFDLKLLHPRLTDAHLTWVPKPGIENPDPKNPEHFRIVPKDPDREGELLEFGYDKTRKPRITEQRPPVPPLGSTEVRHREAPVKDRTVIVGWSLPAGYRSDHWNLRLLGGTVSQYVSFGLAQVYSDWDGDRVSGGCFTDPQIQATTLACFIEIKDKKLDPEDVAEKAMDQIAMMWDPDAVEAFDRQFRNAKASLLADLLDSVDRVSGAFGTRGESIGEFAHWTGDPNYYSRAMDDVMRIEGLDIARLGHEYVRRNRAAVMVADPIGKGKIDTRSAKSSYAGASEGDAVIEASDDLSLATPQNIARSWAKPRMDKLVDTKLPNGLRVVVLPHGDVPKIHARVIFGGGSDLLPFGLHDFVSTFTASSHDHDPLQVAGNATYQHGRPLQTVTGSDYFYLGFSAFTGNVDAALWMMRSEIEGLGPELDGKDRWLDRRKSSMYGAWEESGWHQRALMYQHLYPGSPTNRVTTPEDLRTWAGWGADEVHGYLARVLQPANATVVISGGIDPAVAVAAVERNWGTFAPDKGVEVGPMGGLPTPPMPTASGRILVFDDDKRTQTSSTLACRLDVRGPEDKPAVEILGSLLGNQTFATLRVKEGLAYSPSAFASMDADGSAILFFGSQAVNRGVGRTVDFFRGAVRNVAEGKTDRDEIKLHQLRINRSDGVGKQTVTQMAGALTDAVVNDLSWEQVKRQGRDIAAVTPADLARLVQPCLDHAFISLEGPQDVIVEQLDQIGLEYEIVDFEKRGEELLWKHDPKEARKRAKEKEKEEEDEEEVAEGSGGDGEPEEAPPGG